MYSKTVEDTELINSFSLSKFSRGKESQEKYQNFFPMQPSLSAQLLGFA